jgi:hypothetical protein
MAGMGQGSLGIGLMDVVLTSVSVVGLFGFKPFCQVHSYGKVSPQQSLLRGLVGHN